MALLKFKRSAVPAKVPALNDLALGELAINTYDGKVYTKKDDGTPAIVEIGGNSNGITTITSTDGSVTVTGSGATRDLSVAVAGSTTNVLAVVRNNTGATLAKGTVVYINGSVGQNSTVAKAIANSDATSAQTLGLMTANLANNATGYVTIIGLLTNMDTSAFTDGQQLYLSPTTAGTFTATKPYAPQHLVYVAVVEHAHPTQGKLFVKVQNGYEMDELHDVSAQNPANNDGLFYNTTSGLWENKSIATALGYTPVNRAGDTMTGQLSITGAGNVNGGNLQLGDKNINTAKWSVLTGAHYAGSSEPKGVMLIGSYSASGNNSVSIGGSVYEANPATYIGFFTSPTATHPTGGLNRLNINGSGIVTAEVDIRAPIFRDNENPQYYADFAGTTNINRFIIAPRNDNYFVGSMNTVNALTNFQSLTDTFGQMTVMQVSDITGFTNAPTGLYPYGGVMSWRTENHSYQMYASHTGDLAYKTQWNNDNYSGWLTPVVYGRNGNSASGKTIYGSIFYDSASTGYNVGPSTASTLANVVLASTIDSALYYDSALEIRERSFAGALTTSFNNAPRMTFHWGGRVAMQLALGSDNTLNVMNGDCSGFTPFRAGDISGNVFTDRNNTAYFFNGDEGSRQGKFLTISGNTSGIDGNELVVGNTAVTYSMRDTNLRPIIQAHGAYPVLSLNHTITANTLHGPTVQFTANGTGKQFVIGMSGNGSQLDIGNSAATDMNPHNGIGGYNGITGWRMDGAGNVYNLISSRSPIFRDNDNTAFFVDPDSTSVLSTVRAAGIQHSSGNAAIVLNSPTWTQFCDPNGSTKLWLGGSDPNNYYNANIHYFRNNGSGTTMTIDATGLAIATASYRAPIFYDSQDSGYYTDPNSVSVINKLTASGRSMVGSAQISMAGLDVNTYYPVTIPVPVSRQGTLRIENALNSNAPSWSTHPSGFSCYFEWTTNGLGWGTIPISRRVTDWRESFTSVQIVGGIEQMTFSSQEVIWLRGGGNYFLSADFDVTPTIRTTSYEAYGQTVAPRSSIYNNPRDTAQGRVAFGSLQTNEQSLFRGNIDISTGSPQIVFTSTTSGRAASFGMTDAYNMYLNAASGGVLFLSEFRAPMFRDTDNSAYYLDPATGFNFLSTGVTYAGTGSGLFVTNAEGTGSVVRLGAAWNRGGSYSNGSYTLGSESSIHFWISAGEKGYIDSSSNLWMNGSVRAPIFYDSADSTYYINLNGYSQVNGNGSVNGSAGVGMSIYSADNNGAIMSFHRGGYYAVNMGLDNDNVIRIGGWSAAANRLQMDMSGNLTMAGNVTAYSDARLKEDVATVSNALDLVGKMRGVTYTRKDTGEAGVGVIAQEMLEVMPEVVQQGIGNDDTLSVAYGNLVGVLIEAIKELSLKVKTLEEKDN
jgi:hypothetical protein